MDLTLRNIQVNCSSNNFLALELTTNKQTNSCSYIRREILSKVEKETLEADVICLHSEKFKKDSTLTIKVEGCNSKQSHLYFEGRLGFVIRVWGIDMHEHPIYNEITAFLSETINENTTELVTTIFSLNPFASTAEGWLYDKGFF